MLSGSIRGPAVRDVELEQRRQGRDHRIALGAGTTKEATNHLRPSACAAMMDGKQPAVLRRLNDVTARHRRQAQVAAHQMQIVARKQRDVSRPQRDALSVLSVNSDTKVAFDDVVIDDQVGRRPEHGRAMLGARRAAMHHGAKNSACRNTPPVNCATLKTSDSASIRCSTGKSVSRSCLPVGQS